MFDLKVGAGEVCIDPPQNMYPMTTRFGNCDAIYSPCFCKAIIIDNGEKRILFVSFDMSDQPEIPELPLILGRASETKPEDVVISVTHNHTSPCDSKNASMSQTEEEAQKRILYKDYLIQYSTEASQMAVASMTKAKYGYGETKSFINCNRDYRTPLGRWVCGLNYEGFSDKTLSMLKFVNENGDPIACILNYGAHAAYAVGAEDADGLTKTTGNFPAEACSFVEQYYGNGCICMWTSACAGNQDCIGNAPIQFQYPNGYVANLNIKSNGIEYKEMEMQGRRHGADAVAGLECIQNYTDHMPIEHIVQDVKLIAQKKKGSNVSLFPSQMGVFYESNAGRLDAKSVNDIRVQKDFDVDLYDLPEMEADPEHPLNMVMQLLILGDIAIVCAGAELYAELGAEIKKISPYKKTFVMTHTNEKEHIGYVVDQSNKDVKVFQAYGKVMPGASDERILECERAMFDRVLEQL